MSIHNKFIVLNEMSDFVDSICDTLEEAKEECRRLADEDGHAEVYKLTWCAAYGLEHYIAPLNQDGEVIKETH